MIPLIHMRKATGIDGCHSHTIGKRDAIVNSEKNVLCVGAGKAAIEFPENFFPYNGFSGRYLIGVGDELHARALLVKHGECSVLLVSLELGDITDEWAPEISRVTGIPAENIFLAATHTHNAPYANSTWGERVGDAEKTESFCCACLAAVLKAAKTAQETIRPAKLSFAEGICDINVSRVKPYEGTQTDVTARYIPAPNPHAYSDKTVAVMTFTDLNGGVIAYLLNYAVHSAVLFRQVWGKNKVGSLTSGDMAGAAMRYVEERSPGTVAVYTMGAAGDQLPRYTMVHRVFDAQGNFKSEDYGDVAGQVLVAAMAGELGAEVLHTSAVAEEKEPEQLRFATVTVSAMGKEEWHGGPPMAIPKDYQYTPTQEIDIQLNMIALGNIALLTVPAEIVASIGHDLKIAIKEQGFENAIVITQCNGALQYIANDENYDQMTMEANASHFMKGVAGILVDGARQLVRKLK